MDRTSPIVEVFRTNITLEAEATPILKAIHRRFSHVKANFDLEDCDRILGIESKNGPLDVREILKFLDQFDFTARVLPG
jgi:hypothetical protein